MTASRTDRSRLTASQLGSAASVTGAAASWLRRVAQPGVTGAAASCLRRPAHPLLACALLGALACGSSQHPASAGPPREQPATNAATDTRTPIEQRRDAACEHLGPKLTACAIEDARAELTAGKIQKADFDRDTAPGVLRKNTEEFLKACKSTRYSTRQVRVLEVCFQEEPRCGPLLDCLDHLNDSAPKTGTKP